MSGYRLAAPHGAWIDRTRRIRFDFNGRAVEGYAGDTVASAVLANGIRHVGRSFKLHRPRGIFSCGVEEPTGLLDVGSGADRTPNTRATDIRARDGLATFSSNCWPSVEFDLAAVNTSLAAYLPAGFYYKTFMWPSWHLFEPMIRRLGGMGVAADGPDPERYDEVSVEVEVLVVGAGAAGMQAALSAAVSGRQALLLEADGQPGGWLASQALWPGVGLATQAPQLGGGVLDRLRTTRDALAEAGVELRTRCTVVGLYDHNLAIAIESCEDQAGAVRERLWKIRARRIVLATGAFERPMLFPDNDRPGVMLAGAIARYATHYGVACGKRVVIAAACDSAYGVAQSLASAGIEVAAIVDRRPERDVGDGVVAPNGVPVLHDAALLAVDGKRAVQGVHAGRGDAAQGAHAGRGQAVQAIDADLIASAGGWTPNVNLCSQAGGHLRWVAEASMFVPDRLPYGLAVVGACAGAFELDAALAHAQAVGRTPLPQEIPAAPVRGAGRVPADNQPLPEWLGALKRKPGMQFVDLQNDVAASDVELAARENYRSVEHLKRYTTSGMATDQGKTSNVNALVLMGKATGRSAEQVGTTKFRPPFKPVTLNAIAGGRTGDRYRPLKTLAARAFHEARGASFEEFGGWHRPAAYPRAGEDLMAAAERESAEVRRGVGLFDGSPLGKIEIHGPDAAVFLDLMYVGTMSTLAVGAARYGVLLDENGIVVDDGIVARLSLEVLAKRIDARLPEFFGRLPRTTYGVQTIPESIAAGLPTAYAQPNPADGSAAGVYWITSLPDRCPSYMHLPLALHEAWPGHLMHIALMQEAKDLPAFRRNGAMRYASCIEGWALYCEALGEDLGLYDTPAKRYGRLEMEMWRAVRLVVDTGLHWMRWTRDEAIGYMVDHMAMPRTAIEAEVDRYIGLPGQALAYQLGNLRFRQLRQHAEQTLGSRFKLRGFHDALMAAGPLTLDELSNAIGDWIAAQAPLSTRPRTSSATNSGAS